jgi:hypothetical protein
MGVYFDTLASWRRCWIQVEYFWYGNVVCICSDLLLISSSASASNPNFFRYYLLTTLAP